MFHIHIENKVGVWDQSPKVIQIASHTAPKSSDKSTGKSLKDLLFFSLKHFFITKQIFSYVETYSKE